jgi:hypothetical protein
MKTLCQTKFLGTFSLMACLWVAMPIRSIAALEIPDFDPKPPTENTIRNTPPLERTAPRNSPSIPPLDPPPPTDALIRGGKCSAQLPLVLSPLADKSLITTSAHPTFLFFMPTTSASQLEVLLKDSDRKAIYRRIYNLAGKSGILRVSVPTDVSNSELVVGQIYNWEFNLICEPTNRKNDDYVTGTLQRVPLSVDPKVPLSQLSLWHRYRAFEYDGMVMLDALRRSRPKQRVVFAEWEAWLEGHKLGDLKELPAIELK